MILLQANQHTGFDFFNGHIIELIGFLNDYIAKNMTVFETTAMALGAIFSIIVAAGMAYKMMTLEGKLDVLKLMRPIMIALVLANWPKVVTVVSSPGIMIEKHYKEVYEKELSKVIDLRAKRKDKASKLTDLLREKQAAAREAERAMNNSASNIIEKIGENVMDFVHTTLKGWTVVSETYILNMIEKLMVWIAEFFWQISIYFIFLLKAIYMAVLSIFGPITIACSILPVWEEEWKTWIGRMVSVSLYGVMAYLVMTFSLQIIKYGIMADIEVMDNMVNGDNGIWDYISSNFGTSIQTVVGLICGSMALKSVPEIATWVVPSGIIHAANGFYAGTAHAIQSKAMGLGLKAAGGKGGK